MVRSLEGNCAGEKGWMREETGENWNKDPSEKVIMYDPLIGEEAEAMIHADTGLLQKQRDYSTVSKSICLTQTNWNKTFLR